MILRSARLELIPASLESCDAESRGPGALAELLQSSVPRSWPPPVFEQDDVARIRAQLAADPAASGWTLCYLVAEAEPEGGAWRRDLVGVAGWVGGPSADGIVEIGYAVADEHQRRGYATEAVERLVVAAFADPRVHAVRAHTYPTLAASIGVLHKTGFRLVDVLPDGTARYERWRAQLLERREEAAG